ncbi:hypothetical protein MNBD_ALPHA02-1690 [hydrothermal vent metagenome]|uniref:Uncharacterized protein n=1 Tax=hydrothermal vent metagenome TaxID=652676 RepID=A0A3B0R7J9_9ZZZZ
MNDEKLDIYLRAYQAQTDIAPSARLMTNILAVPEMGQAGAIAFPWNWFDLMMPKAVGWALTCVLGIFLGFYTAEQGHNPLDEEFYLYDQAQVLLTEDMEDVF